MTSRILRIVIWVLILVAVVLAVRYFFLRSDPVPVTVFRVARGSVEETVTNSKAGTVETRRRAALSPEIGGRVEELSVREGDLVETGQRLLRLADADFRARVNLSRRSLVAAAARERQACLAAQQAQREYDRNFRLKDDDLVSVELLEQVESARSVAVAGCEAAQSQTLEAKAALDLAQVEMSKTVLLAPFDGVVSKLSVEVGEWVTPSPPGVPIPAVVEVIQSSAIYISAPLDEVDLAKVNVGQPVRVTLDAYPGRDLDARITRVAPYVVDLEEHSRTVEIEVELDDAVFASTLLPGTSADVEVILSATYDVLRIPSYALIENSRVLVVDEEKLVKREVQVGLSNWAFAEITAGLKEDERIVVSLDRAEVQAGAEVEVVAETLK